MLNIAVKLKKEFRKRFGNDATDIFFCPGRINIIGEHIDYNGGKVMPCAISKGTYLAARKNDHGIINLQSLDKHEHYGQRIEEPITKTGSEWYNYPLGVFNELSRSNKSIQGFDLLFAGDLPIGAGLSSSASITVLTATAMNEMFQGGMDKKSIALLCKRVENDFIGVNCGIMDQFAVAFGKKDHAILLDTSTLEYDYFPLQLGNYTLTVMNTCKPRTLIESKYNERFDECRRALKILQEHTPIQHLCDLAPAQFDLLSHHLPDPVLKRRVQHVVSENERVDLASKAMQAGQAEDLGQLLYASHRSLKEDYEVTGKELNTLIDFCQSKKYVAGARMTGAGFGGSAIALVRSTELEQFSEELVSHYRAVIGYPPQVFSSAVSDGAGRLDQ